MTLNDGELALASAAGHRHDNHAALSRIPAAGAPLPLAPQLATTHMACGRAGSGNDAWTRSTVIVRAGRGGPAHAIRRPCSMAARGRQPMLRAPDITRRELCE